VPSEGTPGGVQIQGETGYVDFSESHTTPNTQDRSLGFAGAPVVLVGIAACLADPPCAAALGMAAILAVEGLKKVTEAIVRASDDSTRTNEKEIKNAEKALRTNQDFRRWFHREYKPGSVSKDADRLNPDLDPEEVLDAYEEWLASGSPRVK